MGYDRSTVNASFYFSFFFNVPLFNALSAGSDQPAHYAVSHLDLQC